MTKEFLRQSQDFDLEDIFQNQGGVTRIETITGKHILIYVRSDRVEVTAENTPFSFVAEVK